MANYDKYDLKAGGFRAPLAADWLKDDLKKVIGVGLDANGRVIKGLGANSHFAGVLVLTEELKARDIVDVMTDGEIVDFPGTPGTVYGIDPAGATGVGEVAAGVVAGGVIVGWTVQADRLIVRLGRHIG